MHCCCCCCSFAVKNRLIAHYAIIEKINQAINHVRIISENYYTSSSAIDNGYQYEVICSSFTPFSGTHHKLLCSLSALLLTQHIIFEIHRFVVFHGYGDFLALKKIPTKRFNNSNCILRNIKTVHLSNISSIAYYCFSVDDMFCPIKLFVSLHYRRNQRQRLYKRDVSLPLSPISFSKIDILKQTD